MHSSIPPALRAEDMRVIWWPEYHFLDSLSGVWPLARRDLIGVVLVLSCCAMAGASKLDIAVLDQSHLAVPAARVEIKLQGQVIAAKLTDETGHAVFPAWE